MTMYIFFRNDGFYPLELTSHVEDKTDDDVAIDNALCNLGTVKVDRLENGEQNTIWKNYHVNA